MKKLTFLIFFICLLGILISGCATLPEEREEKVPREYASKHNYGICYRDLDNNNLKYASWTGTTWNIEIVDNSTSVGEYNSIDIDSNAYPAISYYDGGNKNLKYAKWNGASWDIETVDSGTQVGEHSYLALDDNDYPVIAYYNGDPGALDLKMARWNGSSWAIETVDASNDSGFFAAIALDGDGYPGISYQEDTGAAYNLKYAKWNGASWNIETIESFSRDGGLGIAIAFNSNDEPSISYRDSANNIIRCASWTGSAWKLSTVEDLAPYVGDHYDTSIQMLNDSSPAIAYFDNTTNYNLKYANWNGSYWDIKNVDTLGDVGSHNGLVFDQSGNPALSYWDRSNEALKFARWNNYYWDTETVDSDGDVGEFSAICTW